MAVLRMKKITVYAKKRDRKFLLEFLQRRGIVEISDISIEDDIFAKTDKTLTGDLFQKNAQKACEAVEILNRYSGYKGDKLAFLKGRKSITSSASDAFYEKIQFVLAQAGRIVSLEREIAEAKAESARLELQIESLRPWMSLPFAQSFSGTKKTAVFVGSIAGQHDLSGLMLMLSGAVTALEALHVEIVYADKRQTCFYLVCSKNDAPKAEEALRTIGFTRPVLTGNQKPEDLQTNMKERHLRAITRITEAEAEIAALESMREDFQFLEDHMKMRAEKYGVIDMLCHSRHMFVLQGYTIADSADELKEELEFRFSCAVSVDTPEETEDVPVVLKNNRFAEPTESVLSSYSLPNKSDIDPVGVMGIFHYMLFGLMFSDAGYGVLLAAVCAICLSKFKNMEYSWKKNLRLFFWCGVSTTFWGIVFSSYFGDVVNVVSRTFFGKEIGIPPLWFSPLDNPMALLMFCLAVGVIHLTAGYVLKGVACMKNKDVPGAFYDALFPVTTMYPLIVLLMGSDLFKSLAGFRFYLPSWVSSACILISLASILGVVLTGGRESKSWFKRILKGLYAAYNVLAGWLSDILSYSRLLALGLATGVIASVMNQLGAMIGANVAGVIVFVIVFAVGQTLNFGINVLGAYVHSNRLEFVEFFGKFYEGGGREFKPLGIHTKHYKIVEEETRNG